ncbi:MAG: outer membrane beta-barrel protein [Xanthobacteraceae bacterium]|nr:outer membrane beta-barrel protein [Xanthobacteraceae bacterium]
MKKILGGLILSALLAAPASAADLRRPMPVKAAPVPVVTLYSWTGCYIGGHVGYAWGRKKVGSPDALVFPAGIADANHDVDGLVAGGQVGCNLWQNDRWVFGIEGQASWADIDGERAIGGLTTGQLTNFRTEIDVIGSIAARFGYAFGATGQTLVFIKGGAAFVHEQFSATYAIAPLGIQESDKDLRWGWMVGGGIEQALGSNWSIKAEYNYSHFGNRDVDLCTPAGVCDTYSIKQHVHLVKVGLNWRFGGWGSPVVARY